MGSICAAAAGERVCGQEDVEEQGGVGLARRMDAGGVGGETGCMEKA